ncbi:MAG: phosphoglucosamine mutase [Candidatus Altiarchaeales archaeon WOR_SM1_79]|nr:MAG: phosphoglucosamine mutase [Candidatus Altiarchaeales archaeon WOR_SM1_79]
MKLFGSSGIRGLANKEISVDLVINIGEVLGTLHKRVVIGHDPRTSSNLVLHALTSGLLSTGCEVFLAGMVATPTLGNAARNFDCGVMITASHNPPEYNGIKFINPDGSGFNVKQMREVEENMAQKRSRPVKWDSIKNTVSYKNAVEEHIQKILGSVNEIKLKVVVDCGCGAASNITPYLFRRLGCKVLSLNCQPDGFFPGRNSEPTNENLKSLMKAVVSNGADLGIAHDGDGDRMVAVDEKGNYVGGDSLLSLFAMHEVKKSIVVPVNASMAVDKVVGSAKIIRTKVGDVFVSEMIKKHNADFGGEPSGTWIFPSQSLCPDGILAAARLAELVCKEPLSFQISALPKYPRKKGTIKCPNDRKIPVLETVKKHLKTFDYRELSTQDGLRIQFDHSWALVRPSGTEPKIRITVEADEKEEAKSIYDNIYELVKGCVSQ